jgi:2-oxo-4-hydroxy-4-carboxy-5-ureidoimidazoline decarboxylase
MNLNPLLEADANAFMCRFGGLFENSPWVAQRAFAARPFGTPERLHAAMVAVVRAAPREEQLALLRAHPELAGREARAGTMTDSSVSEQSSAGLDRLSRAEVLRIAELNAAYRARHGFPFIVAVRHYTLAGILHEFERRLANDRESEFEAALQQVFTITRLRLSKLVDESATLTSGVAA